MTPPRPLREREGYAEKPQSAPLCVALGKLAEEHGILGCVLVSFTGDRVAVNSSGVNSSLAAYMDRLGEQLLAAIDDGKFDPEVSE